MKLMLIVAGMMMAGMLAQAHGPDRDTTGGVNASGIYESKPRPDTGADRRAAEWVQSLHLSDPARAARVAAVIATHLKAVRDWNNGHPYSTVPAGIDPSTGRRLSDLDRQIIANSAMPGSVHAALMAGLRRDLNEAQVDGILDKYTMGKVAFTMSGYHSIVPDLTLREDSTIMTNLRQAREEAVDYKGARQISAIFEIYKTRNEQYLNSNGRDWHALFKAYVDSVRAKKAAGAGKTAEPGIVRSQFLYDTAPFPECHAATIAETPEGLVAAFFGGTKERNPDVCIYVCRKARGAREWSAPVNVANGIQHDGLRYACWNPVLYQVPGGELLLFFKVGPSPAMWKGWLTRSGDGGRSWSRPEALPEGYLGPIKNKPVRLQDGTLLCPSSTEGNGWKIHFELTRDNGKTWSMAAPPNAGNYRVIQPTVLFLPDGSLEALCRSQDRAIIGTRSTDNGRTWSSLQATSLPNNNSGIDGVTLEDGRELLVYNHVLPPVGKTKGARTPLNVAVSPDGSEWDAALVLEKDTLGQYSYPSVIQSGDGMVHIVYTWRRKKIRYVEIDPSKLELKKIVDGRWPTAIK